jgi:hypothetical protein
MRPGGAYGPGGMQHEGLALQQAEFSGPGDRLAA